ncbi:MAG: efflux RND transporter periplasmic adaptor subunit [Pseudomonadales bacterium]
MNLNKVYVLPLLVIIIGGALVVFLASGKPPPEAAPPEMAVAQKVDIVLVNVGQQQLTVHAQGTVQAQREIDLVSEVAGKVDYVSSEFVAGGFFAANQTLLKINAADYEIAKISADARVAEADELLATTRGQALQAKREWRDLGSKTANELFLRKPQLARAEAQHAAAKAETRKARLNLNRTSITVPFAGRVRSTNVNEGQYVSPGQTIARVYSIESAEVRLPLTDRQVGLLNLPLYNNASDVDVPVTLKGTFGGQLWQWPALIKRTEAAIDEQSRVVYAVAVVEDPYKQEDNTQIDEQQRPPLTIGQFVQADIQGRRMGNVAAIPRDALRAGSKVWLSDDADTLQIKTVNVVQLTTNQAIISGLPPGQHRLITSTIPYAVQNLPLALPKGEPELTLED